MEEHELLRRLDRVTAPPGFEAQVRALLVRRREARPRELRLRAFRFSLAGAAAGLLALFVVLNTVVLRPGASLAGRAVRDSGALDALPVMETVDYRREAKTASLQPQALYILENVSYASNTPIRY
jgi:hypothetical protein